jgi:hypothetical protein
VKSIAELKTARQRFEDRRHPAQREGAQLFLPIRIS